ncbi:MAG: polysaccharide deacetylase family protein [Proteobacteria bacterium]|nr:polysaccharide deacetylase family protein [Pseudomonadota bacterium]
MLDILRRDKKTRLARLLYHTGLTGLFQRLPLPPGLLVLNYHRIRPDDAAWETQFDDGVFCHTASGFEGQIRWLRKNCRIISEAELIGCIDGQKIPSGPAVLITFDDGYRDNYSLAYPILKSYDVPAIFFIPSQLIDVRNLGWWDVIAYLVARCRKPEVVFQNRRFALPSEAAAFREFLLNRMKLAPYDATQGLVAAAAQLCEVALPDPALQDAELMTWQQIQEVSENGIAIGSHSHTHRVLATLDEAAQRHELLESKKLLEAKTGAEVRSIAYPVGGPEHFTQTTVALARTCGYRLGFSANSGRNVWREFDPLCASRISFPMDDVRTLSAQIVFPRVFFFR